MHPGNATLIVGALLAAMLIGCKGAGEISRLAADAVARGEMVPLGRNRQGFEEYLWVRDSSILVGIPAGRFIMGTDDKDYAYQGPRHSPELSAYFIDKYEVTNRQYERFCATTGRNRPPDPGFRGLPNYFSGYPGHPVANVAWVDAQAYAVWAGKSLPTEAQWEKAARGTRGQHYPWGSRDPSQRLVGNLADEAFMRESHGPWLDTLHGYDDGYPWTAPVGSFPDGASPYGVLDMAGNVWEWVADWYDGEYYRESPTKDPQGPATGTRRVVRGGSWDSDARGLYAGHSRFFGWTVTEFDCRGFRCALTGEQLRSGLQ